jgi:hypothetical protein
MNSQNDDWATKVAHRANNAGPRSISFGAKSIAGFPRAVSTPRYRSQLYF